MIANWYSCHLTQNKYPFKLPYINAFHLAELDHMNCITYKIHRLNMINVKIYKVKFFTSLLFKLIKLISTFKILQFGIHLEYDQHQINSWVMLHSWCAVDILPLLYCLEHYTHSFLLNLSLHIIRSLCKKKKKRKLSILEKSLFFLQG